MLTKLKVDLQVEKNRVKELQIAYENLATALKKQQAVNEQQLQSLKMMQREFISVEKLLQEKDAEINQLNTQLLESKNKKSDIKTFENQFTQTSVEEKYTKDKAKLRKAVFIPIDQGVYAPI